MNLRPVTKYFLCFLALITGQLSAQDEELIVKSISFDIDRNNGSIALQHLLNPTDDGFLWYTTFNGIVKDYGSSHVLYPFEKAKSGEAGRYYKILTDRNDNIWIASDIGVYFFNSKTTKGVWTQWKYPESTEKATIIDLIENSEGQIIAATSGQYVLSINPDNLNVLSYRLPDELYESDNPSFAETGDQIQFLTALDDGKILGSDSGKIFTFDKGKFKILETFKERERFTFYPYGYYLVDNGAIVSKDASGTFIFLNENYSYKYLPSINKQVFQLPSPGYGFLNTPNKTGAQIVGESPRNNQVLEFYSFDENDRELQKLTLDQSFNEEIVGYKVGSDNVVYVSTFGKIHALKLEVSGFKNYLTKTLDPNLTKKISPRGFAETGNGDLFVGTYSGFFNLNAKYPEKKSFVNTQTGNEDDLVYRSLYVENDSIVWNVGDTPFVSRINLETNELTNYTLDGGITRGDVTLFEIKPWTDSKFIIGSTHGLWSFDKETKTFEDESILNGKNNLGGQQIKQVLPTIDGGLWMITSAAGIFYKNFNSGEVKQFTKENTNGGLASNTVNTMLMASDGRYYFGTNEGLAIMDPLIEQFVTYNEDDGLSNNMVVGLLENEDGIWGSTYNGLFCYHLKDDWFYDFYKGGGLPDNEFNQHSFFKSADSTMYFGGLNGVVSFKMGDVQFSKPSSYIKLVSGEFYDRTTNSTQSYTADLENHLRKINLPIDKNFVQLTYAINDVFSAKEALYEYKIIGLNDDWISLGTSNELRLYGLPAGVYEIVLRGKDILGNPTVNVLRIPLTVEEIFYKEKWFIVVVSIILMGFIIGFYQFRRYRWSEKFRQQKSLDQLESKALRAQMNPHFMFNALNGLQSTMILKGELEANKYLGSFSKLLRASLDMSKSDIITLEEEISYLEAYLSLEKQRQARDLEVEIILNPQDIDVKKIKLPCMLFQPLLENAILHGLSPKRDGQARVTIEFTEDGTDLIGIVTDNGIGRVAANELKSKNKKTHKSWATTIMQERIEIINKYTDHNVYFHIEDLYEDDIPSGTKVTLKLPLMVASQNGMI